MRFVRVVLIAILIGIVGIIVYAGWKKGGPNQVEAAFVPGGKIAVELSAGGYEIRGSDENRIRVELRPNETREVTTHVRVQGSRAKVEIDGPSDNFHATIYVPQHSDLQVDQSVGDLVVRNVEGNKKLGLGIGHMQLEIDSSVPLPSFDGGIVIGDLSAPSWHVDKGGFFRSIDTRSASSPYLIKARVDIGQLELVHSNPLRDSHAKQGGNVDENVSDQDAKDDSQ